MSKAVLGTMVEWQPVADYVVQVARGNPEGLRNWDIVRLTRTVEERPAVPAADAHADVAASATPGEQGAELPLGTGKPRKKLDLSIRAVVIDDAHSRSNPGATVPDGYVRIDQTLRQALSLEKAVVEDDASAAGPGCSVQLRRVGRWRWRDTVYSWLDLQKAVVRVQVNRDAMEQFTPVVCLPIRVMARIGASYGSRVVVETADGNEVTAKCLRLDEPMQKYWSGVERGMLSPNDHPPYGNPPLWKIRSEGSDGDHVAPAFLDAILRHQLGDVKVGQPVKVRRSLQWEIRRKSSELGPVALLAVTMLTPQAFDRDRPQGWGLAALLVAIAALVLLGVWATLAASKYRGNNDLI